ncbi:ergothioneine biosynthesis protein EgtC [Microtetraspora sp. NBRC 16547]|uniref:ergothioneine biosynthesis protein EgtC n=1 Tax=Microtetraspora sp. NBRC 16547 TaxID=3030993 RepID=UPI0024A4ADD0|nr:ergothioneine biosynthesis protein EgtC [Microtetraspora sp. NBRC 16547]GLW98744.1 gamma-glutamyl-hercynylcysteine sulfoxide hydrolase [Microtetraspora sp. NBRC 16547]
MCRHAAWLGPSRPLSSLIGDPEHGLLRQAYAPRLQRYGTVNADGFGMGWYDPARAEPVRYRRSVPIWADANLAGLAEVARSGCLLAAVRSATAGMPIEESATAPFADGRWLLSHNGRVEREAVAGSGVFDDTEPESPCDSAWLASAVFTRLRAGMPVAEAVARVVTEAARADPAARLNLLVCGGTEIVATAWGDTLFTHVHEGVLLASEPLDGRPGWRAVDDRTLVLASPDGVSVTRI